jgi:hypothetical protein
MRDPIETRMPPTMRTAPLAALLALAACAHAGGGPAPAARAATPSDYFPLAVGNEWVWEDQGAREQSGRAAPVLRTVRILERTPDGFYRDSERGELKAGPDCVRDRLRQLLCRPLAPGTAWKSVVGPGSTEKYEIVGAGETVVTPAGRFEGCLRTRAVNAAGQGADLVAEITYAPGVGPVRIETFVVREGRAAPQLRALLSRYHLEGR